MEKQNHVEESKELEKIRIITNFKLNKLGQAPESPIVFLEIADLIKDNSIIFAFSTINELEKFNLDLAQLTASLQRKTLETIKV